MGHQDDQEEAVGRDDRRVELDHVGYVVAVLAYAVVGAVHVVDLMGLHQQVLAALAAPATFVDVDKGCAAKVRGFVLVAPGEEALDC